jgi:hypothetical protein
MNPDPHERTPLTTMESLSLSTTKDGRLSFSDPNP